jgi:ribonuclease P protein component
MVVFVLRRDGPGLPSRIGVTATRRVGGAVVRARCRRRLRELFRLHPAELPGEPIDLVVNARRGCAVVPWDELQQDYVRSLRQVRKRLAL